MATLDPVPARLDYLRESARLLAIASPTISSYLGAQYGKLFTDTEQDIDETRSHREARQRELCNRCGNLMIPGVSCKVRQYKTSSGSKIRKIKGQDERERFTIYSCYRCSATTKQTIPVVAVKGPAKDTRAIHHVTIDSSTPDPSTPSTASENRKKRAKARKHGALQAILKDQTASKATNTGLGLDLMDFMNEV